MSYTKQIIYIWPVHLDAGMPWAFQQRQWFWLLDLKNGYHEAEGSENLVFVQRKFFTVWSNVSGFLQIPSTY